MNREHFFSVVHARLRLYVIVSVLLYGCTVHAQEPYKMTINYLNNQPSTEIAVWTVRSLSLTTQTGSSVPDKIAIAYRASTAPTTTLALAAIRDITFSGSPLYTGDTMRIMRKSGTALNIVGGSIQKITFESLPTRVADRNSSMQAASARAYPNPSQAQTTIEFTLPQSSDITAIVYDVQGNEILTLARGYREAGKQVLQWNRTNTENRTVAAGVYVCRVTSSSGFLAETMVVLY